MRTARGTWTTLAVAAALAGCAEPTATAPARTPPVPHVPAASVGPTGQLQYFGYIAGVGPEAVRGTDSYTNFGWFSTDTDEYSTAATVAINSLSSHGMRTIVEMGGLLWCGTGQTQLCPDWQTRFGHWIAANRGAVRSGNVLAFAVRDEPFSSGSSIPQLQLASRAVKDSFPSASILLVEAGPHLFDPNPGTSFNLNHGALTTVDWIAVDHYLIHPATNDTFHTALSRLKAAYPGRKVAYSADGWWEPGHAQAFGTSNVEYMGTIMREWLDVASADPDAVLVGTFIWDPVPGWTTSRDFPRAALLEQIRAGRIITGRSRPQASLPVGAIESVGSDGYARGWACDPDGAWGEAVTVDLYNAGVRVSTVVAEGRAEPFPAACRGPFQRFTAYVGTGARAVTAVIHDLDAGTTTIAAPATVSVAWVKPASVSWGQPNTLTVAGYTTNGTGTVQMVWRDVTAGGGWNVVAYRAATAADGTWSNTIPTSNYCHDYAVYANYSGATSPTFTYGGRYSGYCAEAARVIWIQPQASAGFGPAGSMVVAGSASGAPTGTGVQMYWRDATAGSGWTLAPYAAPTDAGGTWYNSIPNAVAGHQYSVYVKYDVAQSSICTSNGSSGNTWC
jgi:hypothetical protein